MSRTRTAHGFPCVVASLCGAVVAAVSGTTGVVAHWLASTGPMPVTVDALLAIVVACVVVGTLTTAGVDRFPPVLAVPGGLLAGQASVHYALEWTHRLHGHDHAGGTSGHAAHALLSPAEHSALAREAALSGATTTATATGHEMSWPMLASHVTATIVAAGALALIAHVLGWLTARAEQLVLGRPIERARPQIHPCPTEPRAVASLFLLSRGLLRGPPVVRGALSY